MTFNRDYLPAIGLGVTQIMGYGTLMYAYAVLLPHMAADLDLSLSQIFGVLSAGLFVRRDYFATLRAADRPVWWTLDHGWWINGSGAVPGCHEPSDVLAPALCNYLAGRRVRHVRAI